MTALIGRPPKPVEERLFARREVQADGCWVWQGSFFKDGYGRIALSGRTRLVHRVAYEHFVGPVPEELALDHLCRNRACFNPAHLEPVTIRENLFRSPITAASVKAAQTHCIRGHEFDEANTYRYQDTGRRMCRACSAGRQRGEFGE